MTASTMSLPHQPLLLPRLYHSCFWRHPNCWISLSNSRLEVLSARTGVTKSKLSLYTLLLDFQRCESRVFLVPENTACTLANVRFKVLTLANFFASTTSQFNCKSFVFVVVWINTGKSFKRYCCCCKGHSCTGHCKNPGPCCHSECSNNLLGVEPLESRSAMFFPPAIK